MLGPSSSHTAGALRLARMARTLLGTTPERARIGLHGSFAATYRGHGSDRAVVAGLLGMEPDDPGISGSLEAAREAGVDVEFVPLDRGPESHPNTLRFEIEAGGDRATLEGASVGGGAVQVSEVNGRLVELSGRYDTLLIGAEDVPGTSAEVTRLLAEEAINIAFLEIGREKRGREATMIIETDHAIPDRILDRIRAFEWVRFVRRLSKVTD